MRVLIFILILAVSCKGKQEKLQERLKKIPFIIDSLKAESMNITFDYVDEIKGNELSPDPYKRYQEYLATTRKKIRKLWQERDSIAKILGYNSNANKIQITNYSEAPFLIHSYLDSINGAKVLIVDANDPWDEKFAQKTNILFFMGVLGENTFEMIVFHRWPKEPKSIKYKFEFAHGKVTGFNYEEIYSPWDKM